MRDYLDAIRSRVVVFDGGMGATLEQFDLTSDDYGGLPGKCHEALILQRPDVIEGVHAPMVEAGARGGGDRNLPCSPPTSSRASTPRWSRRAPRSWRPTPSRPAD